MEYNKSMSTIVYQMQWSIITNIQSEEKKNDF